jgi:Peptidase A4 family
MRNLRPLARVALAPIACLVLGLIATPASAASTHGGTIVALNANQSTNWFGYDQGSIEQSGKLFNSITGTWNVPTATPHTHGEDEFSSTWIGIGGGCVDANCLVQDATLIQTGTEQDVDSKGNASYSAWWELIPGPSITISDFTVAPGDTMNASIAEVVPNSNIWTITLTDTTRNETFSQTVPYSSTHDTAEWIEETPLLIGTNAGFSALPNLSTVTFSNATTNGGPANLQASEEIQLINNDNQVYATPSSPGTGGTSFNECAWATSCPAPGGSTSTGGTTGGGGSSKGGHKPHSKSTRK